MGLNLLIIIITTTIIIKYCYSFILFIVKFNAFIIIIIELFIC